MSDAMGAKRVHRGGTRFAGVFGDAPGRRPVYDQTLLEINGIVAVPTLGSIVPLWVLLMPKEYSLNFYDEKKRNNVNPVTYVYQLADALGFGRNDVLWFEHGASQENSSVGCGVDYAHLHVILSPQFDVSKIFQAILAIEAPPLWSRASPDTIYENIAENQNYYVIGYGSDAFVCSDGSNLGSQFFRKYIAIAIGAKDKWDYKRYPFTKNVEITSSYFTDSKRNGAGHGR